VQAAAVRKLAWLYLPLRIPALRIRERHVGISLWLRLDTNKYANKTAGCSRTSYKRRRMLERHISMKNNQKYDLSG
jgi:hypothetical protein